MGIIKSHTDLSQSKKLAEILPLESADMAYIKHASSDNPTWEFNEDFPPMILGNVPINEMTVEVLPCWSLAALLNILAEQDFIIKSLERNNEYQYNINIPSRHCKIWFSSLLDAAFEMVCWLKENGKI